MITWKLSWKFIQLLQERKILWIKPDTTYRLYLTGAFAWKLIIKPVSVGLVYHFDVNRSYVWRISISRKGIDEFFSGSTVNFSEGWRLLISSNLLSIWFFFMSRICHPYTSSIGLNYLLFVRLTYSSNRLQVAVLVGYP